MRDFKSFYKNKKILITGHTGFKGSWLAIWLHSLGAKVIGIALSPRSERDNYVLSGLGKKIDKEYIQDIRDRERINKIFNDEKPEIIFHLAAQPLVIEGYQNPVDTYEINVMGTVNILEACRLTESVRTIVVITTDKCYENRDSLRPFKESDPMGGYDPYSSSKGAAELICSAYRNSFFNPSNYSKHKISLATTRAGNVIGGGDWAQNRIIPDIVRALESGREIELRNPSAVRPWQHVLEPLGGYLLLAANMSESPQEYCEAWNFGPETEKIISVGDLTNIFISRYGSGKWTDISDKNTLHEASLLLLDISKVSAKLGWRPLLNIEETVAYTVEWYKMYSKTNVFDLCLEQVMQYQKKWK